MKADLRNRWDAWVNARSPFGALVAWTDESLYYSRMIADLSKNELGCLEQNMNGARFGR